MKLVIFGLTVSSSWGNGHATLWRGLIGALARRGHDVVFYERDVPYYAAHRDLTALPDARLVLHDGWDAVAAAAAVDVADADVAMVTSYCPDALPAGELVAAAARARRVFYDLDTPVTLDRLARGEAVEYVGERGLGDYDLVLSYTGGAALDALRERLGARRVAPLYGSVDPAVHRPAAPRPAFQADCSYLGTYAADRQAALSRLFVDVARRLPAQRFVIGGAQYPDDFPWAPNIHFVRHLPPVDHPAFFCSSRLTLNVTRAAMAQMGWCPSGRLFEAAACGVPVISDWWPGLDDFFTPGEEVLIAHDADDVARALQRPAAELARIGARARERALAEHDAASRAVELERLLEDAAGSSPESGSLAAAGA